MGGFKSSLPEADYSGTYSPRPFGSGGGREYADVSPRHRCPVCGKGSYCQVKRDGSVVLCKNIGGTRSKENRDGVTFHIHPRDGGVSWAIPPAPPPQTSTIAGPATRDEAYRAALASLRLDDVDREGLRARGLSDAAIADGRYRTLGDRGRAEVARAIIAAVGDLHAPGVPGMFWKEGDAGRGWWSFSGWSGLLIPVRDLAGRIVALKVRRRTVDDGGKRYVYVTSSSRGGPSAEAAIHVPAKALGLRSTGRLVLTEGELKADVATELLGDWPVVSLPGVGAWPKGAAFAAEWGAREVAVAFDSDSRTNKAVNAAERNLLHALRGAGWPGVRAWRWDPKFKGIDDMLAAKRRGEGTT